MKFTGETKVFLGIFIVILVIFGFAFFITSRSEPSFTREELIPKTTLFATGSATAKISLVEFSDFQCPACRAFFPTVDELIKINADRIYFVYRHFPLPQHSFGKKAAQIAIAAAQQGKFWQSYDFLFQNQDAFSDSFLGEVASKLNLDKNQFEKDFASSQTQELISQDMLDGGKFGVNATPTFFLNGKKLNLSGPEDLKRIVEEVLAK